MELKFSAQMQKLTQDFEERLRITQVGVTEKADTIKEEFEKKMDKMRTVSAYNPMNPMAASHSRSQNNFTGRLNEARVKDHLNVNLPSSTLTSQSARPDLPHGSASSYMGTPNTSHSAYRSNLLDRPGARQGVFTPTRLGTQASQSNLGTPNIANNTPKSTSRSLRGEPRGN